MAWRLEQHVKRGILDNRERGKVYGEIWLDGLEHPVALELQGNAQADLAGCVLTFENPEATVPLEAGAPFHAWQRGTAGDLTASRKVRVSDVQEEQADDRLDGKLPVPEHLANCLYLEWFSEANGRVVIESTAYRLTVSEPLWRLTAAEEEHRRAAVAEGLTAFTQRMEKAFSARRAAAAAEELQRHKAGWGSIQFVTRRLKSGHKDLLRKCKALGTETLADADLARFLQVYGTLVSEFESVAHSASARTHTPAHTLSGFLRRALEDVRAAQSALERIGASRLLPAQTVALLYSELVLVRGELLHLQEQG